MRDRSDRYQVNTAASPSRPKRLGGYLIEAGLLTADQVDVALNDQQATGMKFGEVLVARGWVKEQTVEWVLQKVAMPERNAYVRWQREQKTIEKERLRRNPRLAAGQLDDNAVTSEALTRVQPAPKREQQKRIMPVPVPPPSAGDVNWVG